MEKMYREIRTFPLFDGLPNQELFDAIVASEMELQLFERDDLVLDSTTIANSSGRIYFVREGQLVLGRFKSDTLADERKAAAKDKEKAAKAGKKAAKGKKGEQEGAADLEAKDEVDDGKPSPKKQRRRKPRKGEPLIYLAEKHLAMFEVGDLFNADAMPKEGGDRNAIFASAPAQLIVIAKPRLQQVMTRHPFLQQRIRRSVEAARSRLKAINGVKEDIFDFFVRHGISVATTLRVRQIDRCIECYECEKACEERYGYKRLTIGGPRLGMLDFVETCRTCTDQRCLDPCNFDSIYYNRETRQVQIVEESCTGCTLCATSCPYGSIEMVPLDEKEGAKLKLRLESIGALGGGDGQLRKAQPKRMASKCDHCYTYGDQACISHCPTGALIEISPLAIFQERSEIAKAAAQAGFDHTVAVDPEALLVAQHFEKGLKITDGANAKIKQRRVRPGLVWGAGLGIWALAVIEVILRLFAPAASMGYVYNRTVEGWDHFMSLHRVDFKPGGTFAVGLGYVGTFFLVAVFLYPMRKKWKFLTRWGSHASWFDFHLMAGVVGPLFICLHTAAKLDNWVSLAFWSMVITALSGLVGRFLYTQVPEMLHGRELETMAHERALAKLRTSYPGVTIADAEIDAYRGRVKEITKDEKKGLLAALGWIVMDDLSRLRKRLRRWSTLRAAIANRAIRKEVMKHTAAILLLERRHIFLPRAQKLLGVWRTFHVPLSLVMSALVVVHIVVSFIYSA
jgi:Fe-S-cluster-containing hydrogenase component 2